MPVSHGGCLDKSVLTWHLLCGLSCSCPVVSAQQCAYVCFAVNVMGMTMATIGPHTNGPTVL